MNAEVVKGVTDQLRAATTRNPDGTWSEQLGKKLFTRLTADGWTHIGLAEELGGSGGTLAEAVGVIAAAAASGQPLPVADMTVAHHFLSTTGSDAPAMAPEVRALLPVHSVGSLGATGAVSVTAERVAWARWASHLLVVTADGASAVHVIDATSADIKRGTNLAGEPRDTVILRAAQPLASLPVEGSGPLLLRRLRALGAFTRSIQIAAATQHLVAFTTTYATTRRQFGRRLADFQAVQQQLAALAGEATAAGAAVSTATHALTVGTVEAAAGPIAAAKCRTGLAAGRAASLSHQVHGAMGITMEYPLHRYTRSMWAWRDEHGGETEWARHLLATIMPTPAAQPWPALASW
jgi:acyl-CoA dehydrogenase